MKNLTLENITKACKGTYHGDTSKLSQEVAGVVIDSRKVEKDYLFVAIDGENVNAHLRTEEVSAMASVSSAVPRVREKLLDLQRKLARTMSVVMDGRDIGTTILPDADVKIYLTASSLTRARRRYLEYQEKGEACDLAEIQKTIEERDQRDMTREISPLCQAEDAVLVDSSELTIDETVEKILSVYHSKVSEKE